MSVERTNHDNKKDDEDDYVLPRKKSVKSGPLCKITWSDDLIINSRSNTARIHVYHITGYVTRVTDMTSQPVYHEIEIFTAHNQITHAPVLLNNLLPYEAKEIAEFLDTTLSVRGKCIIQ